MMEGVLMNYFSHDTGAANDPKIEALRVECKGGAVDAYWVILETIYRDEEPYDLPGNPSALKALAHKLTTSVTTLVKWIDKMVELGLFHIVVENENHGKGLYSERCEKTISDYQKIRETARQNGKKGGRKPRGNQSANRVGTKGVSKPLANKRKENIKEINKEKTAVGSAAAIAAPPACPKCGAKLFHCQTGEDRCLECGEVFR